LLLVLLFRSSISDLCPLSFDDLISSRHHPVRNREADLLCRLQIDHSSNFVGRSMGRSPLVISIKRKVLPRPLSFF
jgi:hypothetical protein